MGSASLIRQSTVSCAVGRGVRLKTGASLSLLRRGCVSSTGSQSVSSEARLSKRTADMVVDGGGEEKSGGKIGRGQNWRVLACTCPLWGHFIGLILLEISTGQTSPKSNRGPVRMLHLMYVTRLPSRDRLAKAGPRSPVPCQPVSQSRCRLWLAHTFARTTTIPVMAELICPRPLRLSNQRPLLSPVARLMSPAIDSLARVKLTDGDSPNDSDASPSAGRTSTSPR